MRSWFEEESGQGMTEYALILAFIALVVFVAVSGLGDSLAQQYDSFYERISELPNY